MTTNEFNDITSSLGLSTKELASKLDRSVSSVKCYLSGERAVPEEIADKMRTLILTKVEPEAVKQPATPTEVVIETIYSEVLREISQCHNSALNTLVTMARIEAMPPELLELKVKLEKIQKVLEGGEGTLIELERDTLKLVKVVTP